MNRFVWALLILSCGGCSSLRDSAVDYAKELAAMKVREAVDDQLEKRGLSLSQLKELVDSDRNGKVDQGEVVRLAKSSLSDFVELKVQVEGDRAKAELEEKLKAVAEVKDLEELRAVAKDQDLFGKGTLGALLTFVLTFAYSRVTSANKHGKTVSELAATNARLDAMEKLTGLDLNRDGRIGGLSGSAQGAQGGGGSAPQPAAQPAAT